MSPERSAGYRQRPDRQAGRLPDSADWNCASCGIPAYLPGLLLRLLLRLWIRLCARLLLRLPVRLFPQACADRPKPQVRRLIGQSKSCRLLLCDHRVSGGTEELGRRNEELRREQWRRGWARGGLGQGRRAGELRTVDDWAKGGHGLRVLECEVQWSGSAWLVGSWSWSGCGRFCGAVCSAAGLGLSVFVLTGRCARCGGCSPDGERGDDRTWPLVDGEGGATQLCGPSPPRERSASVRTRTEGPTEIGRAHV